MKQALRITMALAAGLGLAVSASATTGGHHEKSRMKSPPPAVGAPAPAFDLPSSSGGRVSLKSLRGKLVVLYFYPADETPGCTTEACNFRDNQSKLKAQGVVVLGVSLQNLSSHHQFTKKYKLNFPLLADTSGKIMTAYHCWRDPAKPHTPMNVDRSTFLIGKDGRILKIWRHVNPTDHAERVLQAVKALKSAKA